MNHYSVMAPVVSKGRWHKSKQGTFAKCPRCSQWLEIDCEIEQGFTVEQIDCTMPHCSFNLGDFLRLEGYE